ncbi:hypothetical protein ISN44_As12g021610 [Arabidopsis suecica]|uniref:Uncharacterized protein n=1 Tax=Arabidopsis suecica TaxID=45249 RepID=A0A8T1YLH5_ARASU|nr:hypothetical protein ISN44_As12g021610 [Arabidopsis suecica]
MKKRKSSLSSSGVTGSGGSKAAVASQGVVIGETGSASGGKKKPVPSGLWKSSTGSADGKSKAAVASQGVVIGETRSASGGRKKPVPSSGLGKSSTGSADGKSKAAVASQGVVIGETGSASGGKKKPVPSSASGKKSGSSRSQTVTLDLMTGTKTVEEDNGPQKGLSSKFEYRKQRAEDNRRRNSILPNPYTCPDFDKEWSDEDAVEYGNWLRFERAYRRHLTHAEMDYLAANPRVVARRLTH